MNRMFLVVAIFLLCCKQESSDAQNTEKFTLASSSTGDTYTIQIRKPSIFNSSDSFNMVYATDGSIGIGDYITGKDNSWSAKLPDDCIAITIGHTGDWHMKRRRDFIPSDISNDSTGEFGHANKFYLFLKDELMPLIEKKGYHLKSKSFIGHSFGGLFCLYAVLRNENLFDNYFAISPSVWANYYELMKIEKEAFKSNTDIKANVEIFAGSLEVFNKVLSSSREFYDSIQSRNYRNLNAAYSIIENANHFSIRKPAVDRILISLGEK